VCGCDFVWDFFDQYVDWVGVGEYVCFCFGEVVLVDVIG